jgi:anti-sigma factor RsiW
MTTVEKNGPERSEIEELLPWHAAGTLSVEEARQVDAALASDPELAHRFALAREELAETVSVNESLGVPSSRAMEKLMMGMNAERKSERAGTRQTARRAISAGIGAGWKNFVASLTPQTLAWSTVAAALLIIVQGAIITGGLIDHQSSPGYETASSKAEDTAGQAEALVRFAPQATSADITAFLDRNNASVIAGPMAGGMYRLRLPVATGDPAKIADLLKALQQEGPITFAVPASASP